MCNSIRKTMPEGCGAIGKATATLNSDLCFGTFGEGTQFKVGASVSRIDTVGQDGDEDEEEEGGGCDPCGGNNATSLAEEATPLRSDCPPSSDGPPCPSVSLSLSRSCSRNIEEDEESTSSSSSSSSDDDSSLEKFVEPRPPDGGWGWVVVVAAFFVNLIADGITFSFGVLFVEFESYFEEGKSKTAWIGSVFTAMPLLSGPIASFLTDRYGCQRVTIVGAILAAIGFILSAFVSSIELLFLTFGILAGFGLSLCYVAAVVIVAYYFDRKRSFATGLSVCGSGIGTFIFAPLTQYLLTEYGWRGTALILAGLFLNMCICGALMRDLEWTSHHRKEKAKKAKRDRGLRRRRRKGNKTGSSVKSIRTAASSADTMSGGTPALLANVERLKKLLQTPGCTVPISTIEDEKCNGKELSLREDKESFPASRLCSSLVSLPTFVGTREKVPVEVMELLSTNKDLYRILQHNYPNLLTASHSFSDSGRLNELQHQPLERHITKVTSPLARDPCIILESPNLVRQKPACRTPTILKSCSDGQKKTLDGVIPQPPAFTDIEAQYQNQALMHKKLATSYLRDLRVHRHSLTYRGAMLNINRYRLRASSCPDIYRNSMTTIAKEKDEVWYAGLWELWYVLADMLDFSYFTDIRFLLFALSNVLLYSWYDVPYVYLIDNAIELGFKNTEASYLVSVIGILNMFGEVILGWAGDQPWINPGLLYAACMTGCGVVTALVPLLTSYEALSVVSGAFGLLIAANYSLTSIILVELIAIDRFTNAYGLLLLVQGVANLVGPPLGGWLYDITGSYGLSFYLSGLFIAVSGLLLLILPAIQKYQSLRKRYRHHPLNGSTADAVKTVINGKGPVKTKGPVCSSSTSSSGNNNNMCTYSSENQRTFTLFRGWFRRSPDKTHSSPTDAAAINVF